MSRIGDDAKLKKNLKPNSNCFAVSGRSTLKSRSRQRRRKVCASTPREPEFTCRRLARLRTAAQQE